MNNYKQLINNTVIFAIGNLGTKLVILLLVPLYTYFLTPSEYGIIDLLTITTSLLIPIFTLSIIESILRFVMDKNYDTQIILINSLVITFLGLLFLMLCYPIIIAIFPFKGYVLYLYLLLAVQTFNMLFAQFVRAKGMIRLFAISGIVSAISLLIGNILFLVFFDLSIAGFLLASLIANTISGTLVFLKGNIKEELNVKKIDKKIMKEMLLFSIPLIPNALMWWIMGLSDRYMITYFLGISATGIYAVAVKFPTILNIVNSIFFQAWQMSAIEEADSKDKSVFYTTVFNIFSIIVLLTASVLLILIKPVISVFVGESFFESWRYVPFLLLGVVFSSFSSFLGTNYIASKRTAGVLKTSVIGAIINVLINLALIPVIGINGAAVGTMVSFAIVWLLRISDTKKFVDIKVNFKKLIPTFLAIFLQIIIMYSNLEEQLEYLIHSFLLMIIIIINLDVLKIIFKKLVSLLAKKK